MMTLIHTLLCLLTENRHPVCSISQGRTPNVSVSPAEKTLRLAVLTACLVSLHAGAKEGYATAPAVPAPPPGKEATQYGDAASIARFGNITSPTKLLSYGGRAVTLPTSEPVDEQRSRNAALFVALAVAPNCQKGMNICPVPTDSPCSVSDVGATRPRPNSGGAVSPPTPGTSLARRTMRFGLLEGSLRETLTGNGFPADILAQIGQVFSDRKNVDIDASPLPGDSYRVSYQADDVDFSGGRTHVMAIVLRLQGRLFTAEFFKPSRESSGSYFSFEGRSLSARPFLMPLDNAIVTSPFGIRLHPVKGVMREHTGVDLAARLGTPVMAAAEGEVEAVGYDKRGYGRYVVIQHSSDFSTWYAHLSSIKNGVKVGSQLNTGQVLGAVGRTGDATGPHLHFEVRYRDHPTDPMQVTATHRPPPLTAEDVATLSRQTTILRQQISLYNIDPGPAVSANLAAQHVLADRC
jgi:murein DD-endopeptidase MepM/ murein hydrolase activator NlpD